MSDVDIVLEIATKGVEEVYKLSNAMTQLNRAVKGATNPMRNLDARSRALSAAVGSADSSLKSHAKTLLQVTRNQAILSNELGRVQKEIAGMGVEFRRASGESGRFASTGIRDLKNYEKALKGVRVRALVEDLKSVAQEQKRLGKDAQFVGRSLIIGLTTPILGFGRVGLQALVSVDREFVRLNKVLEGVAPNLDAAARKMGVTLASATAAQTAELNEQVDSYNKLDKSLRSTSIKFGIARGLTVGLAADFAELGMQTTDAIADITELTAQTEKLGNMDISQAQGLVQSLYFQARRAIQQSGKAEGLTAAEFETAAVKAATAQLNLFNIVENQTALSMKDLGKAFPEVASAATTFGLSMTEAAGLLAPMKSAGMEVGASANAIKVSLQRLVNPTTQTKKLFDQLSSTLGYNFNLVEGSGLDAIQSLIDAFNALNDSAAGNEGVLKFFAQVFGVRQSTRMLLPVQQLAAFDRVLKDTNKSVDSADRRLQDFANTAIKTANDATGANLPLINSYQSIGIIARVATAKAGNEIKGFAKSVSQTQIDAAIKVRDAVADGIKEVSQSEGIDLIGQTATEAGKIMYIQLAGVKNAQEVADRELEASLEALDTTIARIKISFKSFAADIIKVLRPAIEGLSDRIQKLYKIWESLSPDAQRIISILAVSMATAAASIGPLIFIFGQFRLAMGSVAKVIFSFLPALKTMSITAVASSSAMLRLTKPLTVVGDTVVNQSGKFATYIATIASGNGPLKNFAERVGRITGVLQKQTTASAALTRSVAAVGTRGITDLGMDGGPYSSLIPGQGAAKKETRAERMTREAARKAKADLKASGLTGQTRVVTPTGPGGRFVSKKVDRANAAVTRALELEKAGFQSGAAGVRGPKGRMRAVSAGDRAAFDALQKARESMIVTPQQFSLGKKGIDLDKSTGIKTFKGRELSDKQARRLFSGGIAGGVERAKQAVGRGVAAVPGLKPLSMNPMNVIKSPFQVAKAALSSDAGTKAKGFVSDLNPIKAYKKSIAGAKASMAALSAEHIRAGVLAPGVFARMRVAVSGFTKATKLGTVAIKLMKVALITSGIGVILLALGVAFILIKNNMDKFKSAASGGLKIVGEAFGIVKNALLEIVRPVMDLFRHFGDGSEGAAGAVSGISVAFNKVAVVLKWLAGMFAMVVDKLIKPWLYMIINIVAAIVSLFQGKWKKAFSFLMAAVAFAVEYFINAFAMGFKLILNIAGGLIKGIVSLLGFLAKLMVERLVFPITAVLKVASMLPFGIGKKFEGLNNKFRGVVNNVKGAIDAASGAVNGAVGAAVGGVSKVIDKGADGLKKKLKGLKSGGIDASKGKVSFGKKEDKKKLDVDTDPAQEEIAKATGDGIKEGADKGSKSLAASLSKSLKEELQNDIQDRIKGLMQDVVTTLTEGLKDQKEASLKIYDDQLKKIDDTVKAEERLTKTKEYENKKREMEETRALNKLNNQRNYALAIYEGRIDDARQISLEGIKSEQDSQKELSELETSRSQELAEQRRSDLIDSIKTAREVSSKYFDDMIKGFTDAAKKITEFPPTTAEKFNEQLELLKTSAETYGTNAGGEFSKNVANSMTNLGIDAKGPLTTGLAAIGAVIAANNPFGDNGVWQTTIDASLEGMKQKYLGLTDTLNMAVGESSGKYQELFTIYKNYKTLVAKNEEEGTTGAGGSGGSGGSGGTGGSGLRFNADGVMEGNDTSIAATSANLQGIKAYSDNYLDQKYGATASGRRIASAIKGMVGSIASSSVLLGSHSSGLRDFNPAVSAHRYKDQIISNSRLVYAYIMNNKSQFLRDYRTGRTDASGRSGFFKGGILPYSDGGPTTGPVQQGIPAILHGGEYVVRNSAVKKYGWGMMQQINQGSFNPKEHFLGGIVDKVKKGIFGFQKIHKKGRKQTGIPNVDKSIDDAIIRPTKLFSDLSGMTDLWKAISPGASMMDRLMGAVTLLGAPIGIGAGKVVSKSIAKIAPKLKKIKPKTFKQEDLTFPPSSDPESGGQGLGSIWDEIDQMMKESLNPQTPKNNVLSNILETPKKIKQNLLNKINKNLFPQNYNNSISKAPPVSSPSLPSLARQTPSRSVRPSNEIFPLARRGLNLRAVPNPKIDTDLFDLVKYVEGAGSSIFAKYGPEAFKSSSILIDMFRGARNVFEPGDWAKLWKKYVDEFTAKADFMKSRGPSSPARFFQERIDASFGGFQFGVGSIETGAGNFGGAFDLARAIQSMGIPYNSNNYLFRGLRNLDLLPGNVSWVNKLLEKGSLDVGDIIPHPSALRTSGSINSASSFLESGSGLSPSALFVIKPEKGMKAAYGPQFAHETEALFAGLSELIVSGPVQRVRTPSQFGESIKHIIPTTLRRMFDPDNFDISTFTKIGGQKGFNTGGVYEARNGLQFYIKEALSESAAKNEELAVRIYELLGVRTASQRAVKGVDGKHYLISLMKDIIPISKNTPQASLYQDLGIHALLGNYDIVGRNFDNLAFDVDNPARGVVIDAGASLFHRGTGGLKKGTPFEFGDNAVETLTDLLTNPRGIKQPYIENANQVFKDIPTSDLYQSLYRLVQGFKIKRSHIEDAASLAFDSKKQVNDFMAIMDNRVESFKPFIDKLVKENYMNNVQKGIPQYFNGGRIPGFGSQGVPAILHGGEYVVNSKAVKNIGFAALEAMNNMRFNTPKSPSYQGGVAGGQSSTSNVNIYVDNFIGEKQWFESMMKDYNINVGPQNQKNAGLQNRTISTYNGINRGL
jgi:TP901 family phage tail tape measure protein